MSMPHRLQSVWVQKRAEVINSSSGQYIDMEHLLEVLRKRYKHTTAYVYACPKYGKMLRLARYKQKPPNVMLSERVPFAQAWEIFETHARML